MPNSSSLSGGKCVDTPSLKTMACHISCILQEEWVVSDLFDDFGHAPIVAPWSGL